MTGQRVWGTLKAEPTNSLISLIAGKQQEEPSSLPKVAKNMGYEASEAHRLRVAQSSQPSTLTQSSSALASPKEGNCPGHHTLLQQIILFSDGLGSKPCCFLYLISAYGSWASRTSGNTAGVGVGEGSQGEAAGLLAHSARSLRSPISLRSGRWPPSQPLCLSPMAPDPLPMVCHSRAMWGSRMNIMGFSVQSLWLITIPARESHLP